MGMCVSVSYPIGVTEMNPTTLLFNFFGTCVFAYLTHNSTLYFLCTFLKQEIVDDYTFECEVGGQAQKTKVSIFQSMGDPLVYGKIYCAKEQKAEEENTDLKLIHPP